MRKLLSCEFNMDTACVELKFADGNMISSQSDFAPASLYDLPSQYRRII